MASCLVCGGLLVRFPSEAAPSCDTNFYYETGVQGEFPSMWRVTSSQLDLPSMTLMPVAGCGRLQLGVVVDIGLLDNWSTVVDQLLITARS